MEVLRTRGPVNQPILARSDHGPNLRPAVGGVVDRAA